MIFILLPLMLLSIPASSATPDQRFIQSCEKSFEKSATPASEEVSRRICECVAKDSHVQGVKTASLKSESDKLEADPKYVIKDEALMNAFRYCTLMLMKEADTQSE